MKINGVERKTDNQGARKLQRVQKLRKVLDYAKDIRQKATEAGGKVKNVDDGVIEGEEER